MRRSHLKYLEKLVYLLFLKMLIFKSNFTNFLPVPISDSSPLAEKAKAMKQSLQGNSAN